MSTSKDKDQADYPFTNEIDAKRMRIQHNVVKAFMGGRLIMAPIDLTKGGLQVIDCGTSEGYWLSDFLSDHPAPAGHENTLIGADIDPVNWSARPKGVELVEQNIFGPWPKDWLGNFDIVHQSLLMPMAGRDLKSNIHHLFELVKPGGWIQLREAEQIVAKDDGPATQLWQACLTTIYTNGFKTPYRYSLLMEETLKEGGFENIGSFVVPFSYGAKCPFPDIREDTIQSMILAIPHLVDFVKREPLPLPDQYNRADLDTLQETLAKEWRERGAYYPVRVVWGQKPLT